MLYQALYGTPLLAVNTGTDMTVVAAPGPGLRILVLGYRLTGTLVGSGRFYSGAGVGSPIGTHALSVQVDGGSRATGNLGIFAAGTNAALRYVGTNASVSVDYVVI